MVDPYDPIDEDMPDLVKSDEDYIFVYLYPYNNNMEKHCKSGSDVVSAIKTAVSDLVSYGAADGWKIYRFRTNELGGNGKYFDEESTSSTDDN